MARAESRVIGLVLGFAVIVGIFAQAGAGPDLEVLMVGKSYSGRAYGSPDSTGRTGSVFEGPSFKVGISESLGCDRVNIVSNDSKIGVMHVLGGGKTGLMTFTRGLPDTTFHLYKQSAPQRPETFDTANLPIWPARKWQWKPESEIEDVESKWEAEDYIGTYVVEEVHTAVGGTLYGISQLKGDDEE